LCAYCGANFVSGDDLINFHHLIPNHLGEKINGKIKDNNFAIFMSSSRNCVMLCDSDNDCHDLAHEDNSLSGPLTGPSAFKYSHGAARQRSGERLRWIAEVNAYWTQIYKFSKSLTANGR
jgi:hypothetical protein